MLLTLVDVIQTKKLRDEHPDDMSVLKAFKLVLDRRPDLRLVTCCCLLFLQFHA